MSGRHAYEYVSAAVRSTPAATCTQLVRYVKARDWLYEMFFLQALHR